MSKVGLGLIKSKFSQERWDVLKTSCTVVGAAALTSDATFDPLQEGKNLAGAASRTLPVFPSRQWMGRWLSPALPAVMFGVKRVQ